MPAVPSISVVIPCYNGLPYVFSTIESVRNQKFKDWELIICDNCSKDGSASQLQQYLNEHPDPRIRLIVENTHLGMGLNWNRSIAHARSPFIKLLPADDILLPSCLEIQSQILLSKGDVGFTTSAKEVIDSAGRVLFSMKSLSDGVYNWSKLGRKSLLAVSNIIGEPGGILFRKSLLEECGLFASEYRYFIDVELYLRFLKKTNLYVSEERLYQFRIHGVSETASSKRTAIQEYKRWLEDYEEELQLNHRPLYKKLIYLKSNVVVFVRMLIVRLFIKRV